jgi:hypothetical protein
MIHLAARRENRKCHGAQRGAKPGGLGLRKPVQRILDALRGVVQYLGEIPTRAGMQRCLSQSLERAQGVSEVGKTVHGNRLVGMRGDVRDARDGCTCKKHAASQQSAPGTRDRARPGEMGIHTMLVPP